MRELITADLRHSLRIWFGSLTVLAVVQISAMCVTGMMLVGILNASLFADPAQLQGMTFPDGSPVSPEYASILASASITALTMAFIIVAVVGSIAVRNVINSIVYQRRRVLALWQLAGMTERQMLGVLRAQVALLSLGALIISVPVSLLLTPWTLGLMRSAELLFTPPMSTDGVYWGYLVGAVASGLVCILAVRGVSKELRAISPLEAIRSEGVRELPMTLRRWISMIVFGAISIASFVSAYTSDDPSSAAQMALLGGIIGIATINTGGPLIIIGAVRAWTRLVPEHLSASWFLARKTLIASTSRTVAAAGSIATAVFLFSTLFSQNTDSPRQGAVFVILVGFPLAVSVIGSVVLVFMAGQQREREIHLAELSGATPAQQKRQAMFEGVIVVVTGSLMGFGLNALVLGALSANSDLPFALPWRDFAIISVILLVLNVIATIVPTMIAHASRDRIAIMD